MDNELHELKVDVDGGCIYFVIDFSYFDDYLIENAQKNKIMKYWYKKVHSR